ncbi:MAG: hypothetical protein ISR77_08725 [Pirellulaceae bacterium]|nr:hypothetical protein [Pirellulaceae bacterium]
MTHQTHAPESRLFRRFLAVSAVCCILSSSLVVPCSASDQQEPLPWWQAETEMGEDSTLVLTDKPWWDRAKTLASGEHILVKSELPGGGPMLVRAERLTRHKQQDAIVWVIDDDGDFKLGDTNGDKDNDCYVVDYDRDGKVDRLVDYMLAGSTLDTYGNTSSVKS